MGSRKLRSSVPTLHPGDTQVPGSPHPVVVNQRTLYPPLPGMTRLAGSPYPGVVNQIASITSSTVRIAMLTL